jgi:hypothetical protein
MYIEFSYKNKYECLYLDIYIYISIYTFIYFYDRYCIHIYSVIERKMFEFIELEMYSYRHLNVSIYIYTYICIYTYLHIYIRFFHFFESGILFFMTFHYCTNACTSITFLFPLVHPVDYLSHTHI